MGPRIVIGTQSVAYEPSAPPMYKLEINLVPMYHVLLDHVNVLHVLMRQVMIDQTHVVAYQT